VITVGIKSDGNGREMMKLKEFLIQSPTGKTHAIRPDTNTTYCGHPHLFPIKPHTLEDMGWRFLDVLPSDEHPPSCKICVRHYDDPLRKQLSSIVKDLKTQINDFLCTTLMFKDTEALGRFSETIAKFVRAERKLREEKKRNEELKK